MNLVVDIGNTRIKAAIFRDEEMLATITDDTGGGKINVFLEEAAYEINECLICTVAEKPKNLKKLEKYVHGKTAELDDQTPIPFINRYTTYHTLGKDRIAAVAGACRLFPGRNVLIIDAGTAIKYEFKNGQEEYLGGNISPGLNMRFSALHDYTSRLPLVGYSDTRGFFGTSTESAIRMGVQNGLTYEINTYIDLFRNKYEDTAVILTGGAASIFENKLKKPIFVISELTLIGLNYILQHAAKI